MTNSPSSKPKKKKKLPVIIAGVVGLLVILVIIGILTEEETPPARQNVSVSAPSPEPNIQSADPQLASRKEAETLLRSWLDNNPLNAPVTIQDGTPAEDETAFYFVLYQTEELAKIRAVKSNSRLLIVTEATGNFTPIDLWYANRTDKEVDVHEELSGLDYVKSIADDLIRFPSRSEGHFVAFYDVTVSSVNRKQEGMYFYDRVGLGSFDFDGANVMVFLNGPRNDDIGFMKGDVVTVYGTFLSMDRNPIPLIDEYAFIFNIAEAP